MLKDASKRTGARNLSDFTRSEVLNVVNSQSDRNQTANWFSSMEQGMAELKITMLRLQSILEGVSNVKNNGGS